MNKKFIISCAIFLLAFIFTGSDTEGVEYVRIVDGDTAIFMIDNEETKVRFLAIDTPESVKPDSEPERYGKEASDRAKELLSNAKEISIEYEEEKEDKFGRTLAWVFVDDKLLQEILVEEGYARVAYLYDDYKYTDILKDAEYQAKKENLRIWDSN